MDPALPLNIQALVAVILIGVATPLVVAVLTKAGASKVVRSLISGITAGAGAVTTYLLDVDGVPDWEHVLGVFLLSVAVAAAFRKNLDPGFEQGVQEATDRRNIGIGA